LTDSFILYKPKDIVAGDFYWMEQKEGKTLFAAADWAWHGVPGALVSVVFNNGLNRSVREYGLIKPREILDKTQEIVIVEFEKSDEEVREGMDIALCSISGDKVEYDRTNNPLWLIRKGELFKLKGDKQPVGKYEAVTPFTAYELNLEKEHTIYIFSDGYSDKFGGDKRN
jgi:serine phosphatase RsbU (regulator of sigma subunit)